MPADDLIRASDMIISLGGDGTMLSTARLVGDAGIPILGVNLGKLGFLAEVSIDELGEWLEEILRGNYSLDDRLLIGATASQDGRVYPALNEIVIDRGESSRVLELETFVDDEFLVTYAADGIIVTTPTGSTAYSLASGGPIITPSSNVLGINPISPHSLTARPMVLPNASVIRVSVKRGAKPIHLTADGQVEKFYEPPVEFLIRALPYRIRLVKRGKRSYYDLLRTKLLWGRDVRIQATE
jgi:NAD+ kinase